MTEKTKEQDSVIEGFSNAAVSKEARASAALDKGYMQTFSLDDRNDYVQHKGGVKVEGKFTRTEAEKSLCVICNQPVLASELGGVNKDKEGKIRVFHEECIIKEKEGYKINSSEKPLSDDDITNLRKLLEAYLTIEQKGWLNTIIEEARKQAAAENEKLWKSKRMLVTEVMSLKERLKESEQKTAGIKKIDKNTPGWSAFVQGKEFERKRILEEIENKMSINRANGLEFFVIQTKDFEKLKEKYKAV